MNDFKRVTVVSRENVAILSELAPQIIGKVLSGWACFCGCLSVCDSTAIKINIPQRHGAPWYLWSVTLKPSHQDGECWSCGLNKFIPEQQLDELFAKYYDGEFDANF